MSLEELEALVDAHVKLQAKIAPGGTTDLGAGIGQPSSENAVAQFVKKMGVG